MKAIPLEVLDSVIVFMVEVVLLIIFLKKYVHYIID